MPTPNQPLSWQVNQNRPFLPITYDGAIVGFCEPEYASEIVDALNDQERLKKALRIACLDITKRTGGDPKKVEELMKKYLTMAQRPKYGSLAIAFLLRDRQEELDVSDKEFARFCDSYKLSVRDIKSIYAGQHIEDNLLEPIARILGKTVAEIMEVRDGPNRGSGTFLQT